MQSQLRICRAAALALLAVPVLIGLPALGSGAVTSRSKPMQRPPYYLGDPAPDGARLAVLPVEVAASADMPESWIPGDALRRLALEIDGYLSAFEPRLVRLELPAAARRYAPPTATFGCALDDIGECDVERRQNELSVSGGDRDWRDDLSAALADLGADHALRIELRLSPQWIHQKNLSGKKEVRLGSDQVQPLAWLTSLDSPVWVLQLSGVIVDGRGKVVRGGAEGIWAVRTPFRASVLRVERLMTEADVDTVRTATMREDLPGRPAAWQVAVRQLVGGLTAPPGR